MLEGKGKKEGKVGETDEGSDVGERNVGCEGRKESEG